MDLEPWEALDIDDDDDDSDLSNFLRPCNHRSSLTPLIPGPAGSVQAAMIHRRTLQRVSNPLIPTQEFITRFVQNGNDTHRDFNSKPWLSALQFLHSSSTTTTTTTTPLSLIKKQLNGGEGRVDLILAVIKSCTPNGFGDMMVTLKDPKDIIGATIHRKVFTNNREFAKDITVGSVLLLQKVAVFSPNASTCYLNITYNNIVKVFPKDSGTPSEQISMKLTTPTSSAEIHEKSCMPQSSVFSLPQETTEGIFNNHVLDSRFREVADNGKQRDEILVSSSCNSDNGDDRIRNQSTVSYIENLSPRQHDAGPVEVTCGGDLESEMEDQQNHGLGERDNLVRNVQANSVSANSAHVSVGPETGLERQKEIMNPRSSMPQWTDEQLDELLAFD